MVEDFCRPGKLGRSSAAPLHGICAVAVCRGFTRHDEEESNGHDEEESDAEAQRAPSYAEMSDAELRR